MPFSLANIIAKTVALNKYGGAALDYAMQNADESDRRLLMKLKDPNTTPEGRRRILEVLKKTSGLNDQMIQEFEGQISSGKDIAKAGAVDLLTSVGGGAAASLGGKALGRLAGSSEELAAGAGRAGSAIRNVASKLTQPLRIPRALAAGTVGTGAIGAGALYYGANQQAANGTTANTPAGIPSRTGSGSYTLDTSDSDTAGSTDGSGGTATGTGTTESQIVVMNGVTYNLSNDVDRQRYLADRMTLLTGERDRYITDLQTQLGRNLTEAEAARDAHLSSIDQDIADTEGQAKQFVETYTRNKADFTESKNLGDVKRRQFFTSLAPNAYQSSEGTSADFGNKQYLQGVADLVSNAEDTVGGEFLSSPTDYSKLGTNSVLGRQRANLTADRNHIGQAYNDYLGEQRTALESGTATANSYVNDQADDLTGTLVGLGGVGEAPKYTAIRQAYSPTPVNYASVDRYKPFTNFEQTSPAIQPGPTFTPRQTANFSKDTNLETYLGTTQLSEDDKNVLRQYLMGTV